MNRHPILTLSVIAFTAIIYGNRSPLELAAQSQTLPGEAPSEAAAGDPAESSTSQAEPGRGKELIKLAREMLHANQPIEAELREMVHIGGRQILGRGRYIQGERLKLRLELELRAGEGSHALGGKLLQICDGQILWTRHQFGDEARITRRDVTQILKAAAESGAMEHNILVAELGLGGLTALLAALDKSMVFDSVVEDRFGDQRFTIVEGRWNSEMLTRLGGPDAKPSSRLAEYVPERVRLFLDERRFPHRIVYLKKELEGDAYKPLLSLDFRNVVLHADVDEKQFDFVPPSGERLDDITGNYIEMLRKSSQNSSPPKKQPSPSGGSR